MSRMPRVGVLTRSRQLFILIPLLLLVARQVLSRPTKAYRSLLPWQNRLSTPWVVPPRHMLPTLHQARNRVLYSPLRERGGEGLGHNMETVAADIAAAFRFKIGYSHRRPWHGSLSRRDPDAVEKLFGWGRGYMRRNALRDQVCVFDRRASNDSWACQYCRGIAVPNALGITRLAEIPLNLSYQWEVGHDASKRHQEAVRTFLRQNALAGTLFQMPAGACRKNPVARYVDRRTRSYLFHRYWDTRARWARDVPEGHILKGGVPRMSRASRRAEVPSRGRVEISERELNVAVHARRGDFFAVGRPMVSTGAFGAVVRAAVKVVMREGGAFAGMPVAVYVYSEGAPRDNRTGVSLGHDMARLSSQYQDAGGRVQSAAEVRRALEGEGGAFPNGVRVAMRISTDTVQAVHEMVSADLFIGSESSLSFTVVETLSRAAAVLIPAGKAGRRRVQGSRRAEFDGATGALLDEAAVANLWRAFRKAHAWAGLRARVAR